MEWKIECRERVSCAVHHFPLEIKKKRFSEKIVEEFEARFSVKSRSASSENHFKLLLEEI